MIKLNNMWCHDKCQEIAEAYFGSWVRFEGDCHESCKDENCELEHSDWDIA